MLGLLREGGGVGAIVLRDLGLNLTNARSVLEKRVEKEARTVPGDYSCELTFDSETQHIMNTVVFDVAREGNHNYVGTEHILYALATSCAEGSVVSQILKDTNISTQDIEERMGEIFVVPKSKSFWQPKLPDYLL